MRKGYVRIERRWQSGDRVSLKLAMPVERVYPHPSVSSNAGRVALQRGPLVYCLEAADNPTPLHRIQLPTETRLESRFDPTLLGGVTVISGTAEALHVEDWSGTLYRTAPAIPAPYALFAIPYYAWDHRQPGEMCVWIRQAP